MGNDKSNECNQRQNVAKNGPDQRFREFLSHFGARDPFCHDSVVAPGWWPILP